MSRVGQAIINIPDGVEVKKNENVFWVKGSKGELNTTISNTVNVSIEDKTITVEPNDKTSKGCLLYTSPSPRD